MADHRIVQTRPGPTPTTTTPKADAAPSDPTCTQAHCRHGQTPGTRVRVEDGPTVGLRRERMVVIGSGPQADVRLSDRFVSARHCGLRLVEHGVLVEDLGSKNGTFVGGLRIERACVSTAALIGVGQQRLHIEPSTAASRAAEASPPHPAMVGGSSAFRQLQRSLSRLAPLRQPVMLRGETGTGKELAARTLHDASPRAGKGFVALDCASIVDGLAESMLFGHLRGAFTGAHRDHAGAFARADGGTLFLDEVAELPLPLQAKLLRALETGRIVPVGSEAELAVDVRVVAATHRPLEAMVTAGEFREDLYHRLGVLVVELPALRQRRADIPELLAHFATLARIELGRPVVLSPEAVRAAEAHDWPGNIRALRNAVLRAGALCEGPIRPEALVPPDGGTQLAAPAPPLPRGDYDSMKRELLRRALEEHGSIRQAAVALGVPRSTLGAWVRKLGIESPARARLGSSPGPRREREARTVHPPPLRTMHATPR